jgi:hypothetical protein
VSFGGLFCGEFNESDMMASLLFHCHSDYTGTVLDLSLCGAEPV